MKKLPLFFLVLIVWTSGCASPASAPTLEAATPTEIVATATALPATSAPTPVPTETLIPVTLPPPALPVCSPENSITGCEAPSVTELDRFCAQEKPYTLYAFPPGTSVESVTPNFTCKDEGLRKGSQQYSCTGTPGFTFRARVCNTACTNPVNEESDQCPRGYGVNAANNCCVPVETSVNGCVEISLQVGQCQ